MINKILLPHQFKRAGWIILVPAVIAGLLFTFTSFENLSLNAKVFAFYQSGIFEDNHAFSFITTNILNTIIGIVFIIGAMFVAFSKEKKEDEFISELRLSSLAWAVYVNYLLLLVCFAFIYGVAFLTIMVYNMFTVLIIFIARFNYILYKSSKAVVNEK